MAKELRRFSYKGELQRSVAMTLARKCCEERRHWARMNASQRRYAGVRYTWRHVDDERGCAYVVEEAR